MALRADNQPDWNDIYVWQEYEEMTNIHIDWIQSDHQIVVKVLLAALASGDMHCLLLCAATTILYRQKLYVIRQ